MAVERIVQANGLTTDPGELIAPRGGFLELLNVELRRPGVIQPRPGFDAETINSVLTGPAFTDIPIRFFEHQGDTYVITEDAGGLDRALYNLATDTQIDLFDGSPDFPGETTDRGGIVPRPLSFDGAIIYNGGEGTLSIHDEADGARQAGAPQPKGVRVIPGSLGGWTVTGDSVAYRAVYLRREDGREMRSAPSFRTVEEFAADDRNPILRITLPDQWSGSDAIEIYRSEMTSGSPSDDLRLALVVELSGLAPTDIYITGVIDSTRPDSLGVPLYTNDTQQGILQGNAQPPLAADLAAYERMVWYAQMRQPFRQVANFSPLTFFQPSASSYTAGSPTVTGLTADEISKVYVGMQVADGLGTYFSADAKVTAVNYGAGSFTVDENAGATGSAPTNTIKISSVIDVDGVEYAFGGMPTGGVLVSGSVNAPPSALIANFATQYGESTPGDVVTVLAENPTGGWDITFEHADASNTTPIEITGSEDLAIRTSTGDALGGPGYIAWSKVDEPEAVPITQWAVVGDKTKAILRIIPTRDVLWVLKEDGTYTITAGDAETVAIREFDRGLVLLRPEAADGTADTAYAWTNHGVIAVTLGGIQQLSRPAIGNLLYARETGAATGAATATTPSLLAIDELRERLYLLVDGDNRCYVLNLRTMAWARWQLHAASYTPKALYVREAGLIEGARSTGGYFYTERTESYDEIRPITISSIDTGANTATLSAYLVEPRAGDVLDPSGANQRVMDVDDTGPNIIVTVPDASALSPGTYDIYESIPALIRYVDRTDGTPGDLHDYSEITFLGDALGSVGQFYLPWSTGMFNYGALQNVSDVGVRPARGSTTAHRTIIPRSDRREGRLDIKLIISEAGVNWRFSGFALRGRNTGRRVTR